MKADVRLIALTSIVIFEKRASPLNSCGYKFITLFHRIRIINVFENSVFVEVQHTFFFVEGKKFGFSDEILIYST